MAAISTLVDRVKIYVLSSGTGSFQLGGAVPAFRGVEALIDGLTYSYAVENGSNFEAGTGTYLQSTGQFVRAPIISSNGGAAVNFPANAQLTFTALAQDISATGSNNAVGALISSTNYLLAILKRYGVRTSAGSLGVTLPPLSQASLGSWIDLYDVDAAANTGNVTVSPSGSDQIQSFGNLVNSQVLDTAGFKVIFVATPVAWSMVV